MVSVMNAIGLLHALLSVTLAAGPSFAPDEANELVFPAQEARVVRFVISANSSGQPCLDGLEVYGPQGQENLARAAGGAKASASSCLPGYTQHAIAHLNDGRYGNDHSWIAATGQVEWAQLELPSAPTVAKVVFSRDREKRYRDRMPLAIEVRLAELDCRDPHRARTFWDTLHLVAAVQGIVNSRHAVLFIRTQPFPDGFWWNYLREPGNWLAGRPVVRRQVRRQVGNDDSRHRIARRSVVRQREVRRLPLGQVSLPGHRKDV